MGAEGEALNGSPLTMYAFTVDLGTFGGYIVAVGLALFAYSTMLGWCYYGEKAVEYLSVGILCKKLLQVKESTERTISTVVAIVYRLFFVVIIYVGSTVSLKLVWGLSDIFNGLMAAPNLLALLLLSPVVIRVTKDYFDNIDKYD